MDAGAAAIRPGITADELGNMFIAQIVKCHIAKSMFKKIDEIIHKATIDRGAYPSPLNYYKFPKSVCM